MAEKGDGAVHLRVKGQGCRLDAFATVGLGSSAEGEEENAMRAAYYSKQGPAREVLRIGELPTPQPSSGRSPR